jgi:cyanobactin maturation PatA/PatG family protease
VLARSENPEEESRAAGCPMTQPYQEAFDRARVDLVIPPFLLDGLNDLYTLSQGHADICVAILDGPVDVSHPCFSGSKLSKVGDVAAVVRNDGAASCHGTHVASVIFGQRHSCVAGLAPLCRGVLMPIFSDGSDGKTTPSSQLDLARAIMQALAEGAQIINVSGGQLAPGGEPDEHLAHAIRLCAQSGVLVVAAAGNDGCECLHVPAAAPSVLAVGAMDSMGRPLQSSNWGPTYQIQGIMAPGENIVGATPGGGLDRRSGTSYATPIVSGIAALLLSLQLKHGRKPDPSAIRDAILRSAFTCNEDVVSECRRFLAGKINIRGALEALNLRKSTSSMSDQVGADALTTLPPVAKAIPLTGNIDFTLSSDRNKNEFSMEGDLEHMSDQTMEIQPSSVSTTGPGQSPVAPTESSHASPTRESTLSAANRVFPSHCGCGGSGGKCSCGGKAGSECSCGGKGGEGSCTCSSARLQLVYALGTLGYDYGTEARRDAFIQEAQPADEGKGKVNFNTPQGLEAFFEGEPTLSGKRIPRPEWADAVIWTLNHESTPIYAIRPCGPFAAGAYEKLRQALLEQNTREGEERVEQVALPGVIAGKVTLLNGQCVPVIAPDPRGLLSWSISRLVKAVVAAPRQASVSKGKKTEKDSASDENVTAAVTNFLQRVYYDYSNLGLAPQERAINYAVTNAFQVTNIFKAALNNDMRLCSIDHERSPICRPGADCWDVKLTFFNPVKRLEQANHVYKFTVDVSDVLPVSVGSIRDWEVC